MADQGQQRRQTPPSDRFGSDFSITSLDVPETVEPGREFTAVAVVSYRRREVPRQQHEVIFEIDGTEIGEAPTDGEGRASLDHSFDAVKTYRISAQIRGVPASRVRKLIRVDRPKPKSLGKPTASAVGGRGNYLISVHVPHEDGSPAEDVPVRLLVTPFGAATKVVDLTTDQNGFAVGDDDLPYRLEFPEAGCGVIVQAAGREIPLKNLSGPPQRAEAETTSGSEDDGARLPDDDVRLRARAAGAKFADDFLAGWRGPSSGATASPVAPSTPIEMLDQPGRLRRLFRRLLGKREERP